MSIVTKSIVNADAEARYLSPGELDRIKGFVGKTIARRAVNRRPPDFGAPVQRHDAKRRAMFVALADHVQVTHLEDAQGQQAPRVQHGAQREQRQ